MNKKSNSLWHKVTPKEKEQIKKDSKKLLQEFASKLSKIKTPENYYQKPTGTREEGDGWETNPEFQSITFANAPFIENNSIVAEKGTWKK